VDGDPAHEALPSSVSPCSQTHARGRSDSRLDIVSSSESTGFLIPRFVYKENGQLSFWFGPTVLT